MSPRLVGDYPEKFSMRVSTEQRVNLVSLAWYLGMNGKYGLSMRWFIDKYFPVFYASLTDEERARFEEHKAMVIEEDYFESPLLAGMLKDQGEVNDTD